MDEARSLADVSGSGGAPSGVGDAVGVAVAVLVDVAVAVDVAVEVDVAVPVAVVVDVEVDVGVVVPVAVDVAVVTVAEGVVEAVSPPGMCGQPSPRPSALPEWQSRAPWASLRTRCRRQGPAAPRELERRQRGAARASAPRQGRGGDLR
ncbi:MAG: hypothetical protein IPN07_16595 [Dehalococcoidia bacterium]|nr:hypothetical protein [Dehalococcoidia bacterium]